MNPLVLVLLAIAAGLDGSVALCVAVGAVAAFRILTAGDVTSGLWWRRRK